MKFLNSIVYISSPVPSLPVGAVDSVLRVARNNNAANDVTGLLIFNGRYFVQCIEGNKDAIQATYSKIERDRRHSELRVLFDGEITERSFPNWSMGYRQIGDRDTLSESEMSIDDAITAAMNIPRETAAQVVLSALAHASRDDMVVI